jgi:hypothetical protein
VDRLKGACAHATSLEFARKVAPILNLMYLELYSSGACLGEGGRANPEAYQKAINFLPTKGRLEQLCADGSSSTA